MTEILEIPKLVTVFGGSGFVGRHVVSALARRGYCVRVACRRPDLAGHVQPLGNVGQIQPVQANLRMPWSVERAVEGAHHVINLVAILHEGGLQSFQSIHESGARTVAQAARAAGAQLTHVSALGASSQSPSLYARTKAEGERAVLDIDPDAVIFRPSVIFGPEDDFYNRLATMARYSPVLPLIGGGMTRFQPVYVGDVAEAVARSVEGRVKGGTTYELGGPQIKTFRECMTEMLDITGRRRLLVSVPWPVARLQGTLLGLVPKLTLGLLSKPLLTTDQVEMLKSDNIVSEEAQAEGRTFAALGIEPETTAAILPSYLWSYRVAGQFARMGNTA